MSEASGRFAELLALDGPAREARLAELERAAPEEARELRSLLHHHAAAEGFLERPPALDAAGELATRTRLERPERIGSYRVIDLLGEGGMGVVWLAEQEHPRRTVALKVLQPSLATPRQLARFEREAQLLGRLEHKHIARIYEAGLADAGAGPQPFLAMEHVRGRALDRFADEEGLDLRARVALLVQVCEALEHAHAHGVVHRDLKPANVLVAGSGAEAEVKVLDFGVARALDATPTTSLARTLEGQLVGTLPYMSPEQAAGASEQLDARADVYALGVLAYELLGGRRPYALEGLALPEAVRVIRESEPPPLSALRRELRGDLETVVAKALAKEPARRYASAGALADDLRRWLAQRPVLARPPSASYQLAKLARRHRALFAGLAATVLALAGGLLVALRQNELLRRERDRAEAQRAKADAVATWLEALLSRASPWSGRRDVTLREVLEEGARELPAEVLAEPEIEARVRATLGVVFQTLGETERARDELTRALERARAALGDEHERTLALRVALAGLELHAGEAARAEPELAAAEASLAQRLGALDPRTLEAADLLASARIALGRYDEAARWLERSPALHREAGETARALEAAASLGAAQLGAGRLDDAIATLQSTLEESRAFQGARHPNTMMCANGLATALARAGRIEETLPLRRELVESAREVLGDDHPDTWTCRLNLGQTLVECGRAEEGLPLLERALAARERLFGADNAATAAARNNLAHALSALGRSEEAEDAYLRTLASFDAQPDHGGLNAALARQNLALVRLALGRTQLACDDLREALAQVERALGPAHWQCASVRANLGSALREAGALDEAERELSHALAVLEPALGAEHPRVRAAAGTLEAVRAARAASR